MYKVIALFTLLTISFSACESKKSELEKVGSKKDIKKQAQLLNDFLKKYEEPSQTFTVASNKVSKVIGKQGTLIEVNPENLIKEDGSVIKGNIVVELKELTNQQQLLNSNAQTVSGSKLLVSGGAYYINMTSDGIPLKLKEHKTLSVNFPKKAEEEMALFYGQRDSLNNLDWKEAKVSFAEVDDTFYVAYKNTGDSVFVDNLDITEFRTSEESNIVAMKRKHRKLSKDEKKNLKKQQDNAKLATQVYDAIALTKLGWINCDRFYNIPPEDKTALKFVVDDKDSISYASIFVIFKDINSVTSTKYSKWYDAEEYGYESQIADLPIGLNVKVIAFSIKDGKAFVNESEVKIVKDKPVKLNFKAVDESQIKKLLTAQ